MKPVDVALLLIVVITLLMGLGLVSLAVFAFYILCFVVWRHRAQFRR